MSDDVQQGDPLFNWGTQSIGHPGRKTGIFQ